MKREIIIFSGYNFRALIAFIRTLEKNSLGYSIIAKSENDEIFETIYSNRVVYTRKKRVLDIEDILYGIGKAQQLKDIQDCFIVPSTEALNRFILDNRYLFEEHYCIFPVVEKKLYEQISDKYSFGKLCHYHNIEIPQEFENIDAAQLPFVAKPKRYYSDDGMIYVPKIIYNTTELNAFKKEYSVHDFYLQKYIKGRSIYLLYYFYEDGTYDSFSQENYVQQEDGKSMIHARSSTFHTYSVSDKFVELFLDIHFRGLVMIELKVIDDSSIMIEANPRFWGPSQLFVDAGTNLFESLLMDYTLLERKKIKKSVDLDKEISYFWDDGISKNLNKRENLSFYNYSKEDLEKDLELLSSKEIYNRVDSIELYKGR